MLNRRRLIEPSEGGTVGEVATYLFLQIGRRNVSVAPYGSGLRRQPLLKLDWQLRVMQISRQSAILISAALAACVFCIVPSVPASSQSRTVQAAPKVPAPPPEDRIDINHASSAELLKVPGMTPSWAGRIVRFRPYRTKQDLLDRGVLPSDVYARIKDYVIAHHNKQ